MRTPWGEVAVADSHVHFFSHRFFSLLAAQANLTPDEVTPRLAWDMPAADPAAFARRWVDELDRHGVSRAALIASLPGDETSVEAAVTAIPDRFTGFFMVNPTASGALENTAAAIGRGVLQAVCLFPAMHRYSLADERVEAVAGALAERKGRLLFIHCGVLTVGVRKKLGLPSPFDLRYSNPVDVHALALRHPTLPIVIPHFGAGCFREALMVADLCPNVFLDTSSTNSWIKYQEPGCDLKSVFRRALDVAGPARLLFGTDSSFFPRGWHRAIFDEQVTVFCELGLEEEPARAILEGNFRRITAR